MDGSGYLTSILQNLSFGSSVYLQIFDCYHIPDDETTLPIEAISNWLHKPAAENAVKSIKQKREEKRHLHLYCSGNGGWKLEMVEHLKRVPISIFYF